MDAITEKLLHDLEINPPYGYVLYGGDLRQLGNLIHKLRRQRNMLENSLALLLPLAKGYTASRDIESNRRCIEIASQALEQIREEE